jgi:hypothetical protein
VIPEELAPREVTEREMSFGERTVSPGLSKRHSHLQLGRSPAVSFALSLLQVSGESQGEVILTSSMHARKGERDSSTSLTLPREGGRMSRT